MHNGFGLDLVDSQWIWIGFGWCAMDLDWIWLMLNGFGLDLVGAQCCSSHDLVHQAAINTRPFINLRKLGIL